MDYTDEKNYLESEKYESPYPRLNEVLRSPAVYHDQCEKSSLLLADQRDSVSMASVVNLYDFDAMQSIEYGIPTQKRENPIEKYLDPSSRSPRDLHDKETEEASLEIELLDKKKKRIYWCTCAGVTSLLSIVTFFAVGSFLVHLVNIADQNWKVIVFGLLFSFLLCCLYGFVGQITAYISKKYMHCALVTWKALRQGFCCSSVLGIFLVGPAAVIAFYFAAQYVLAIEKRDVNPTVLPKWSPKAKLYAKIHFQEGTYLALSDTSIFGQNFLFGTTCTCVAPIWKVDKNGNKPLSIGPTYFWAASYQHVYFSSANCNETSIVNAICPRPCPIGHGRASACTAQVSTAALAVGSVYRKAIAAVEHKWANRIIPQCRKDVWSSNETSETLIFVDWNYNQTQTSLETEYILEMVIFPTSMVVLVFSCAIVSYAKKKKNRSNNTKGKKCRNCRRKKSCCTYFCKKCSKHSTRNYGRINDEKLKSIDNVEEKVLQSDKINVIYSTTAYI